MKRLVIPTIFAENKEEFRKRFDKLVKISRNIQIDFMDEKFVKSKSINLQDIPSLKKHKNSFEAHLMCNNPEKYIEGLKLKGFSRVIFHYESVNRDNIVDLVKEIRKTKMEVYLAINPETNMEEIIGHIHSVDGILFLGVHPGKEKQSFILEVFKKIRKLREFSKEIFIQVDGGINLAVAQKLKECGANAINVGSFVDSADNPKEALESLKKVFI